ncbi:HAD family hydrolase [Streptomyces sp. 6N223]|uniref:HAD family hydrolase n=1 Tax=Streptomyces sp. 6N223 TaxID=3457412 RepID=UPI003FD27C7C
MTPFSYRLVATDLDGTLLRSDGTVSRRTRAALAAATAAGAAHIVATGRSVAWTQHILEDLGYEGLAICGQGAQLYHAGERRLLTSVTLDRALARHAVALLEAELGPLGVAVNRDGMAGDVLMDDVFWEEASSAWRAPRDDAAPARLPVHVSDRAAMWSEPLIKLYLHHPDHTDDGLAAVARALLGDAAQIVVAGERLVELLPLGLTKATGLSVAARRLGATAAQTIAFGDMPNDIPMLRWSAHGVAMADAHPELVAVADEVTGSNDADGIAEVLERLLP